MRGKPKLYQATQAPPRITPAGAGKTANHSGASSGVWDHPRRCGENIYAERMTPAQAGSPPQVRGKLLPVLFLGFFAGITPAGAGKTVFRELDKRTNQDHPRRCGENF